jgi:FkbM family methyltransferase
MWRALIRKTQRLLDILSIPNGLLLKYREEAFSPQDMKMCLALAKSGVNPTTVFDVGANIGQFALAASETWPDASIISYEPVDSAFKSLEHLAKKRTTIQPRQMALGNKPDRKPILVSTQTQSSSFLPFHANHQKLYPTVSQSSQLTVDVSTISDELSKLTVSGPMLLKLDVQGYEFNVLEGARECLKSFQWILFETSSRPMYEGEKPFSSIADLLISHGFQFETPVQIHFSGSGAIGQFDALFTRRTQ